MRFVEWLEGALPERWRAAVWARGAREGEGGGGGLHEVAVARVGE